MIRVECKLKASIGRYELEDYIRPLDITIYAYTADGDEVVMGKIAADQLRLLEVNHDGVDLVAVCDQDSGGMADLFGALFDEDNDFQPELDVDMETHFVLFLWNSVIHPNLAPYHSGIIETVCDLFGHLGAVVMRRSDCTLSDRELADLKFSKIAGSEFVFRHLSFMSEFTKINPQGTEVPFDFEVEIEDEEWVMERWEVEP